jgi:ADP-heptose:LPS heptosyltransferase
MPKSGQIGIAKVMVKKILAIKIRELGDTVLWTSALSALKILYPEAELHVLSLDSNRALLESHPAVDRFIGIKNRRGFTIAKKLLELRWQNYDLALAFHATTSLCRWLFLAGAKEKIAHHHSWTFTPRVSDRKIQKPGVLQDVISRDYEILNALGWHGPHLPTSLNVAQTEVSKAEYRLHAFGLNSERERIVLLPGAREEVRLYPLDQWAEVLKKLQDSKKFEIAMVVDQNLSEHWSLKEWAAARNLALFDRLSLDELLATISCFDLSISNDSGPGHMAIALGLNSVHIYGKGCVGDWHPYDLKKHPYLRNVVECRTQGPQDNELFRFCTVQECSHLRCLKSIIPGQIAALALSFTDVSG